MLSTPETHGSSGDSPSRSNAWLRPRRHITKEDAFVRPKEILFPIVIVVIVGALIAPHITRGDWNGAIGALLFAVGGGLIGLAIAARREKRQQAENEAKKDNPDPK